MVRVHKISGSEVLNPQGLLPGYAALTLGPPRRWHWRWRHTTLLATALVVALSFAGSQGFLP
jgi:hypothetical protein